MVGVSRISAQTCFTPVKPLTEQGYPICVSLLHSSHSRWIPCPCSCRSGMDSIFVIKVADVAQGIEVPMPGALHM